MPKLNSFTGKNSSDEKNIAPDNNQKHGDDQGWKNPHQNIVNGVHGIGKYCHIFLGNSHVAVQLHGQVKVGFHIGGYHGKKCLSGEKAVGGDQNEDRLIRITRPVYNPVRATERFLSMHSPIMKPVSRVHRKTAYQWTVPPRPLQ